MKERPILMSTENVKAILEGRKAQSRRVIKPQPDAGLSPSDSYSHIEVGKYHPTMINKDGEAYPGDEIFGAYTDDGEWGWKCPYGQVGDRLWVREGFCDYCTEDVEPKSVCYKALPEQQPAMDFCQAIHWRPSIFMPRWASRITLEITKIRVERVKEITEEDTIEEGSAPLQTESWQHPGNMVTQSTAVEEYERLWDSLNPKYPWQSNPWVWVINFKRVT